MLHERVRLVASHLRNAMEYINKLQNQTVVVQYERETLQDKYVVFVLLSFSFLFFSKNGATSFWRAPLLRYKPPACLLLRDSTSFARHPYFHRTAELEEERAGLRIELRQEKDAHQAECSRSRKLQRELDEIKAAQSGGDDGAAGASNETSAPASSLLSPVDAPATAAAALDAADAGAAQHLITENEVLKEEIAHLTKELDEVRDGGLGVVARL